MGSETLSSTCYFHNHEYSMSIGYKSRKPMQKQRPAVAVKRGGWKV